MTRYCHQELKARPEEEVVQQGRIMDPCRWSTPRTYLRTNARYTAAAAAAKLLVKHWSHHGFVPWSFEFGGEAPQVHDTWEDSRK
jgi:hypothetical protein